MSYLRVFVIASALIVVLVMTSAAETLVDLNAPKRQSLASAGFEITKPMEVQIEAVGLRSKWQNDLFAYGWVLNSSTRELVWVMRTNNSDRSESGKPLRKAEHTETLPAGKYEVYMFVGNYPFYFDGSSNGVVGVIRNWVTGDDEQSDNLERYVRDCYIRVTAAAASSADVKPFEPTGEIPNSLIRWTQLGDEESHEQAFQIDKPITLRVYALTEQPKGYNAPADGGWILNAETHERVWSMNRVETFWAGGDRKNRKFDDEIRLNPGKYILYYATDDSHSFEHFNANPPTDPLNWGITVLPGQGFDRAAFHLLDKMEGPKPLLDMTKAGNDENLEQPFRLSKQTNLRIYALGEYNGEFSDYGWIQDARTNKTVWEMTRRNTEPAGGAEKNRQFNGEITLPAGDYMAYYSTDASHSYRDWNDSRPLDPSAWGLAIFPGKGCQPTDFQMVNAQDLAKTEGVLVRLIKVRDDERRRATFKLDKTARVHVYSLGEGTNGDMYDYGWIENTSTGRTVWEMTWRNTDPAGGADKNRMFDDVIVLEPGEYDVFYVTDDSHAFNDWNAGKPRDPSNWGITVSLAEK